MIPRTTQWRYNMLHIEAFLKASGSGQPSISTAAEAQDHQASLYSELKGVSGTDTPSDFESDSEDGEFK